MKTRLSLLLMAAYVPCALAGCALVVGKIDYADYRAVRLAGTEPEQLQAMQRYVARHPDGHYAAEVQSARAARELPAFEASKSTRAGLTGYLAAFPDGVFVAQARSRLAAVELIEQQKATESTRASQLVAERQARDAELRRTWVTRFVRYWGKTLLGLSAWGASIAEVAQANPTFSRAFGAEPRPRCTQDECVKYYESAYAVPVPGGTRVERTLSLVLRLRMREGKLERAELLLPRHGYSRWFELEHRELVVDADAQARRAAVAWAIAALKPMLDELGAGVVAEAGYELGAVEAPAIAASGERIDTSAEDPSTPPDRLSAAAADETRQQPDVAQLVKPQPQEGPADMVFAPVQVDKAGRAHALPTQPAPQGSGSGSGSQEPDAAAVAGSSESGESMVMAPMLIPKPGTVGPTASASPTEALPLPPLAAAPSAPPVTNAVTWKGLRIVVFAAAASAGEPAYDGVIIERLASGAARAGARARQAVPTKRH